MVLDTLGGEVQNRSFKVLKKGGRLASTTTAPDENLAKEHDVKTYQVAMSRDGESLEKIADLIEQGEIRPVVEKNLDLSEVKEGHQISQTGHARGKTVLKVQ